MDLSELDYDYPEDLVAYHPSPRRSDSKMMVLDRKSQSISHHSFSHLSEFLQSGDVLILNNSKVFPCRLISKRKSGGKIECLLLREIKPNIWECMIKSSKKIHSDEEIEFSKTLSGKIIKEQGLVKQIELKAEDNLMDILHQIANVPLPPYIKRQATQEDLESYQTVYAKEVGSVAAPTAGLHFTSKFLSDIQSQGIEVGYLSLHVGMGTFTPIRTNQLEEHQMHGEYYDIPSSTVDLITKAKQNRRRVIAVGTTSVRALESAILCKSGLKEGTNYTEHFIYPPYDFKIIDGLITNFHQPKTTLLALVSAFAGKDFIMRAYKTAVNEKYRLFSYGDCMLIL